MDLEVQGEKPPREPTKHVIAAEEISRIPGTNGDAIRAIGNMPGVARPPGGDGMLIVRGSSPNDTAGVRRRHEYSDGLPLRRAVFGHPHRDAGEARLLPRATSGLNTGAPWAAWSMSAFVRHARIALGGLLQFDLIDARLLIEGPLSKSTRFMVAGRRSWLDAWLGPALKESGVGVTKAPVYYDYQAMVEHDISRQTTLRLFAFGADDRFKLTLE